MTRRELTENLNSENGKLVFANEFSLHSKKCWHFADASLSFTTFYILIGFGCTLKRQAYAGTNNYKSKSILTIPYTSATTLTKSQNIRIKCSDWNVGLPFIH